MILFNIDVEHASALIDAKIPLECLFILEKLIMKEEFDGGRFHQTLLRKGYVDVKGNITKYGEELYNSMFQPVVEIKANKRLAAKEKNEDFKKWWNIYPQSNYFEYNGRTFEGTQSKRIKEAECQKLFLVYTNSEFSAEDVIRATEFHINTAKKLSYKKSENQLTFIKNSHDYLVYKCFVPFIERSKAPQSNNGDFTVNVNIDA